MKKTVVIILVLALLVLVAFGIGRIGANSKAEPDKTPVTLVEVAEATIGVLEERLSVTGDVAAQALVTVYAKVPGEIQELYVEQGQRVKKNQRLAVIEHEEIALQVQGAEAELLTIRTSLGNVEKEMERIEDLFQQGVASQQRYDEMKARLEIDRARLQQAEVALALAKKKLTDATVCAPIEGIVSKRLVDAGDTVGPSVPLLTIVDIEPAKVLVNVIEKSLAKVRQDAPAKVRVDAYPDEVFAGTVKLISPVADERNRTIEVELEVPNPEGKLKPGMFARVELLVSRHEDALLVPLSAIMETAGEFRTFAVEDGSRASLRTVETGHMQGQMIQILEGLSVGEEVVVAGQYALKDGETVKVLRGGS